MGGGRAYELEEDLGVRSLRGTYLRVNISKIPFPFFSSFLLVYAGELRRFPAKIGDLHKTSSMPLSPYRSYLSNIQNACMI